MRDLLPEQDPVLAKQQANVRIRLGKRTFSDLKVDMTANELRDRIEVSLEQSRKRLAGLAKITEGIRTNVEKSRANQASLEELKA